jgi:hypothetical protein
MAWLARAAEGSWKALLGTASISAAACAAHRMLLNQRPKPPRPTNQRTRGTYLAGGRLAQTSVKLYSRCRPRGLRDAVRIPVSAPRSMRRTPRRRGTRRAPRSAVLIGASFLIILLRFGARARACCTKCQSLLYPARYSTRSSTSTVRSHQRGILS